MLEEKNTSEFEVDATIENVAVVCEKVSDLMENNNWTMKSISAVMIAIDELFGNIANYAYKESVGKARVKVEINSEEIKITFSDAGVPYNPLAKEDPDVTLSAEDRKIGGLGIFMVKKMMDDIQYEYKNKMNNTTITKKIKL